MGELEAGSQKPSSADLFFDDERLLVVAQKSFGGFTGAASISELELDASDTVLGEHLKVAWRERLSTPGYDEEALHKSWKPVSEFFHVADHGTVRHVVIRRGVDSVGVVPTEWKGDNRFFRPEDGELLALGVSDEELGAAVRRAMELTVS